MSILELFKETPVIPIVTLEHVEDAEPLARALATAGLANIEISLKTDVAFEAIHEIKRHVPSATVGAGHITEVRQIEKAIAAGAKFLVSPGLTPGLAKAAKEASVPFMPGAMTPSDIILAKAYSFRVVRYFPAEALGGVHTFKIVSSLFPKMHFVPAGGIGPDTLLGYYLLPNVIAVAGAWVAPPERIATKDWKFISMLAKKALTYLED